MFKVVIICSVLVSLVSSVHTEIVEATGKSQPEWLSETDKRHNELCAGVLAQVTMTDEIPLDLDSTKEVYEVALDHLAKSASYVTQMRPYLSADRIATFDSKGSELVKAISEGRVELLNKYSSATESNASEVERRKILARHLYEACELRIPTIMAEKMMLDLFQKLQANLNVKPLQRSPGL